MQYYAHRLPGATAKCNINIQSAEFVKITASWIHKDILFTYLTTQTILLSVFHIMYSSTSICIKHVNQKSGSAQVQFNSDCRTKQRFMFNGSVFTVSGVSITSQLLLYYFCNYNIWVTMWWGRIVICIVCIFDASAL